MGICIENIGIHGYKVTGFRVCTRRQTNTKTTVQCRGVYAGLVFFFGHQKFVGISIMDGAWQLPRCNEYSMFIRGGDTGLWTLGQG